MVERPDSVDRQDGGAGVAFSGDLEELVEQDILFFSNAPFCVCQKPKRHRRQPVRSGAQAAFTLGTAACWAPQHQRGPINTSSKAGASAAARDAAGHARPAADRAVARCTATESCVHQRRAQAVAAAWRRAGGARSLRRRTKSRTRARAPVPQRPPTSEPSTTRRWGPLRSSSGYVASLRRVAVANAAPSVSAERPCGWPSRDTGETKVASQQSAPPQGVTP